LAGPLTNSTERDHASRTSCSFCHSCFRGRTILLAKSQRPTDASHRMPLTCLPPEIRFERSTSIGQASWAAARGRSMAA
jgi:hypothetical protein